MNYITIKLIYLTGMILNASKNVYNYIIYGKLTYNYIYFELQSVVKIYYKKQLKLQTCKFLL